MREADIDRLFQLPPGEFTRARNALTKEAGGQGAAIRRLQKPPLAAWAVNQLFWKHRPVYDALVASAEGLRRVHKAVLTGRRADVRAASQAHDRALDAALKQTLALLDDAGHKATDAARQAISKTLRALPSAEPAGRLTRTLEPGGFEMLAGITPAARRTGTGPSAPEGSRTPAHGKERATGHAESRRAARDVARAREHAASAARALHEAEQQARRAEFENARTVREAEKARARLDEAREALGAAERGAAGAEKARETAERHARDSRAAVDAARDRAEAAQAALDALKSPSSRDR